MPRLQPAHEEYWPTEPSPLGLHWYTAADVEEDISVAADVEQPQTSTTEPSDVSTAIPASEHTRHRSANGSGEIEESPRKRRRITTASDERAGDTTTSLTMEFARRAATSGPERPNENDDHSVSASSPSPPTFDAGWSFRRLDTEAAVEDTDREEEGWALLPGWAVCGVESSDCVYEQQEGPKVWTRRNASQFPCKRPQQSPVRDVADSRPHPSVVYGCRCDCWPTTRPIALVIACTPTPCPSNGHCDSSSEGASAF